MNLIFEAIKTALIKGEAKVNLREAAGLAASGSGIGGNIVFDDAFSTMRQVNPMRQYGRVIPVIGSDAAFVARTGNATYQTNPWGYPVQNNTGTPGIATTIWQLPVRAITAQLPIRTAVLSDINGLDPAIVADLADEFAQVENSSMVQNNDQSGTTTTATGGTSGLRGLLTYGVSTSAAAFGSSGSAITNGLHTILSVAPTGSVLTFADIASLMGAFPAPYWHLPGTAWMMHPTTLRSLRFLKDTNGMPVFIDAGVVNGQAQQFLYGWPIITNGAMDTLTAAAAVGTRFVYLANWPRFTTIGDQEEMSIQRNDQYAPGFVSLYAEKRVVATVRDPFAGVVLGT